MSAIIDNLAFTQGELSAVSPMIIDVICNYFREKGIETRDHDALNILVEALIISRAHLENGFKIEISHSIILSAERIASTLKHAFFCGHGKIQDLAFQALHYTIRPLPSEILDRAVLIAEPEFNDMFCGYYQYNSKGQIVPRD